MKGVIVRFDAPRVTINGAEYQILISPMELLAACSRYLSRIAEVNPADEAQVRCIIMDGCDIAEEALGAGAMAKIAAGAPVSLPGVMKVLNAAMDAANRAYHGYVRRNYGGGQ